VSLNFCRGSALQFIVGGHAGIAGWDGDKMASGCGWYFQARCCAVVDLPQITYSSLKIVEFRLCFSSSKQSLRYPFPYFRLTAPSPQPLLYDKSRHSASTG